MNNFKSVRLDIPDNIPEPYDQYVGAEGSTRDTRGRNVNVAHDIADILNLPYRGRSVEAEPQYHVLSQALDSSMALKTKLNPLTQNYYGAIFENLAHTDKSVLHRTFNNTDRVPSYFSKRIASLLESVTIPGYTAFDIDSAILSFNDLCKQGHVPRIKLMGKSDGRGQFSVTSLKEFIKIVRSIEDLEQNGIVIETSLSEDEFEQAIPQTFTAGQIILPVGTFTYFGKQKDLIVNQQFKYGGIDAVLYRSDLERTVLLPHIDEHARECLKVTKKTLDILSQYNPSITRFSVDIVEGYSKNRSFYRGVTDLTTRIGGSEPALIVGLQALKRYPHLNSVSVSTELRYNPSLRSIAAHEKIFLNHKDLQIVGILHMPEN